MGERARQVEGENIAKLSIENAVCQRHCSMCDGDDHHWMPYCDDEGDPLMVCKHCSIWREMTDDDDDF